MCDRHISGTGQGKKQPKGRRRPTDGGYFINFPVDAAFWTSGATVKFSSHTRVGQLMWLETIINYPPNHHKIGGKNDSQMGGLLLF